MAAAVVLVSAAAVLAADVLADGGATPGAIQGWDGTTARYVPVRYVALPGGGAGTVVTAIRRDGGRVERSRWVRGGWGVPLLTFGDGSSGGLSADAGTLVLEDTDVSPTLKKVSRFLVLDPRTLMVGQRIRLRGDFAFDALSPRGQLLYLIQHLSAKVLTRYVVRVYDLSAHRLLPKIVADRREGETVMHGYPWLRATAPDARWVYTLYEPGGGTRPFVHALDTRRAEAVCIDLPWKGARDLTTMQLVVRPRKHRVVLRNRDSGRRVVVIDTRTWRAAWVG